MEAVTVTGETAWVWWVGKQKETCANQVSSNLEPLERKINEREIGSRLEVTGNG